MLTTSHGLQTLLRINVEQGYDFQRVINFRPQGNDLSYLQLDQVIALHVNNNHYVLAIIRPTRRDILIIDSISGNRTIYAQNLLRWYQEEVNVRNGNNLCDARQWPIKQNEDLNVEFPDRPKQTDVPLTSCGVFVAMTAIHYMTANLRQLPTDFDNFGQENVPRLRRYLAWRILNHHTRYQHNLNALHTAQIAAQNQFE